ncbi:Lcl domain-containing protein, partial [Parabacteroides chinchillae]
DFSLRRHTNYTLTVNVNNSLEFIRNYVTNSTGNLYYKADDPRIWHSAATVWVPINQALTNTYKSWLGNFTYPLSNLPPFNYDGGVASSTGSDRNGVSSIWAVSREYSIEVEKTDRGTTIVNYQAAIDYCKGKGSGWRVPIHMELKGMYNNQAALQSAGCAAFRSGFYWGSSVYGDNARYRTVFYLYNDNISWASLDNKSGYVRCVRDTLPLPAVVTINQTLANAYKSAQSNLTYYPPFNYDYGTVTGTTGSDYKGTSSTATINTPYSIEVSKTQPSGGYRYDTGNAKAQCTALGSGWRLPTQIELFAMYQNKSKLEAISGFAAFISTWYWSSSVYNGYAGGRCLLDFSNGNFSNNGTGNGGYVRCVRDI